MSSTSTPAPPPFSYAQAARGFQAGTASSQKSTDVSAASSEKGARGRQSSSTDGEKLENRPKSSDAGSGETASLSTTKPLEAPRPSSVGSKEVVEKESAKDSKSLASSEESKTMMPPATVSSPGSESSGNHKVDESSIGPNGGLEAWDRQSEVSTSVEKGNAVNEKENLHAGDDEWEKVSVPSLTQERELKAAPPPTVNIWQQRKQAQEAKQREQAFQRPVSSGGKAAIASGSVTESAKSKGSEKAAGTQEREVAQKRKPVDTAKVATEKPGQSQPAQGRPSSRGQQSTPNLPPPPPVGDAVAWPTPDTATDADDRRKPSTETNDKVEARLSGAKQPKKWTQVPFVPTAVFNTPLPPAAAKRGGRGGIRGGRDGTGRGGHMTQNSVSVDKTDLSSSMGPPPLPPQDRGRRPDASRGGRATSVPTHRRRSASNTTAQAESRQASGPGPTPAGAVPVESFASGKAQGSRSSSRPTNASSRANPNANLDTPDASLASENTHSHPTVDPAARGSIPAEWYGGKPSGGSTKPTNEQSTKERSQPRNRTVQESRDKVESWRDRDLQTDASIRRESRNERGGRGTYRGRGNNAGYLPATSQHAYTAPLPQQPFAPHKSHSYTDSRQRQASQPYTMQPVSVSGRQNIRSQSIPMSNGMQQPLSPIQTDMPGMYGYYPGQMLPGVMAPVPHNPALDMYGLMALVTAQLDYYFSIDNLCRDLYLRKHMDSQGFVSLRFLGDFKRIASMTRDMEMLRISAAQSKTIELRQGDDGEDRVRRRDGWEQWVLSTMDERDPSARNPGPSAQLYQPRRPQFVAQYSNFVEAPYAIPGPMRSPSWGVQGYNEMSGVISPGFPMPNTANEHGMNEHASPLHGPGSGMNGDRNDASVLPSSPQGHSRSSSFVPAMNGAESNTITNGHDGASLTPEMPASDQENVFPNDKVPSIWVYARKGEDDAPLFASHATRTLSQGSRGGIEASEIGLASPTFVSGLRGGAASPEQIQRLHSREPYSFIDPTRQNGTFFLKEGVSQNDFDREGSDPWPYQLLHAKAVDQQNQGLHGPENHEMEILYQFWPTFLIQNFNTAMYKDFYRFSLEDLGHGSTNGSTHLARYYGYRLSADKPLTDLVARDIVAAIGQEHGDARPVFQKLRAFWRDGAFNFKSRKRLDNLLDAGLREELGK